MSCRLEGHLSELSSSSISLKTIPPTGKENIPMNNTSYMKSNISIFICLAASLVCVSCDDLSVNERVEGAPVISSFSPGQGSIGTEIEVEGERLDDVVSASVGGVGAELSQKISDKKLRILVPDGAVDGKIALVNDKGEGTSEADFIVEYPEPEISVQSVPSETEMGNKLLLRGNYMNVISAVVFTAEGFTVGHEAEIISKGADEIVVKVPYVESDDARITFRYFNGRQDVTTDASLLPLIKVARYQPEVTTSTFPEASVGDVVTLDGTYLNKVDRVLVGGIDCQIASQSETELSFTVPTSGTYVDGDNVCTLSIVYFDGVETKLLTDRFIVKVPFVYYWKDRAVYGQGRDVGEMVSFFSPETGVAYHNSLWRGQVDPVSYANQAKTCSANQTPAVSQSDYDSVNPYFFFSGTSAGALQVNSPAGSASQLKNFYFYNNSSNDYRVTNANANCYGTPVLTYLYLDPANQSHKQLIDEEKRGLIERIDETTFTIDEDAKTCRGISISSLSNSINNNVYAPGVFAVGQEKSADIDSYILVFYYNHLGLDTSNRARNIKRIGLLHIKHVDFKLYNNTNAPSSSKISFDMYWMKHDYKH